MTETLSATQSSRSPDEILRRVFGEPEPPVHLTARPESRNTVRQLTLGETIALGVACASLVLGAGKAVKDIRKA